MNSKAIISALIAMSLATGGVAFGQGYGNRHEQAQRGDQQDRRNYQGRQSDRRQDWGRANSNQQYEYRGAGPRHEYQRGDRLPIENRHRHYVVDNWRDHNLSAPPRGYHWVQTGGDYVLVAIATGIILQLMLNN